MVIRTFLLVTSPFNVASSFLIVSPGLPYLLLDDYGYALWLGNLPSVWPTVYGVQPSVLHEQLEAAQLLLALDYVLQFLSISRILAS